MNLKEFLWPSITKILFFILLFLVVPLPYSMPVNCEISSCPDVIEFYSGFGIFGQFVSCAVREGPAGPVVDATDISNCVEYVCWNFRFDLPFLIVEYIISCGFVVLYAKFKKKKQR
jgi:hypothetical protein